MLVVDINTLHPVNFLNFMNQICLYGFHTFYLQYVMWIYRTFCKFVTGFNLVSVGNFYSGTVRNQVASGLTVFRVTTISLFFLVSDILTVPFISEIIASPFGFLASNNSSTRGRPWVMSSPATPPYGMFSW